MARSKGGLQKNICNIFQDADMPEDILTNPIPEDLEPEPDLVPVAIPPLEASEPETAPEPDMCVSIPEVPATEPKPEPQAPPEGPGFSDSVIEGQMKKQKCEKNFSCYESGLEDLCQARVIHKGKTVQCLEPKTKPCAFRLSSFFKRLCQCPIRIRIAKKHGK
ncbi:MAG: hypothetical protein K9N55_19690 [Phycisphaerae bacterium]|nr:hypothetical protein [Phycisphaerae bacterium]